MDPLLLLAEAGDLTAVASTGEQRPVAEPKQSGASSGPKGDSRDQRPERRAKPKQSGASSGPKGDSRDQRPERRAKPKQSGASSGSRGDSSVQRPCTRSTAAAKKPDCFVDGAQDYVFAKKPDIIAPMTIMKKARTPRFGITRFANEKAKPDDKDLVAPTPASDLVAPAPASDLVAPAPASDLVAPAPASDLVAPAPASNLFAPAPASDLFAPAPASDLFAPAPASDLFAPTPASDLVAPTPASNLVAPTPASDLVAPTPASDIVDPAADIIAPTPSQAADIRGMFSKFDQNQLMSILARAYSKHADVRDDVDGEISRKLYVHPLPLETTLDELQLAFSIFGPIRNILIQQSKLDIEMGSRRGFVLFENAKSAGRAAARAVAGRGTVMGFACHAALESCCEQCMF